LSAPRDHLRLVERPADALDAHHLPSLPELAVLLVEDRLRVRYARREMLLQAWAAGHEGRRMVWERELIKAAAALGMREAYRTSARLLRPFDRKPAPKR